ncbi:MAG: hypothetical protein CSA34_00010 [Desulfobulbus propionicus]|nr:MAG: hypothetical protein CSA34_00010 [Desulfobulbus propionicus]
MRIRWIGRVYIIYCAIHIVDILLLTKVGITDTNTLLAVMNSIMNKPEFQPRILVTGASTTGRIARAPYHIMITRNNGITGMFNLYSSLLVV